MLRETEAWAEAPGVTLSAHMMSIGICAHLDISNAFLAPPSLARRSLATPFATESGAVVCETHDHVVAADFSGESTGAGNCLRPIWRWPWCEVQLPLGGDRRRKARPSECGRKGIAARFPGETTQLQATGKR